MTGRIRRLIAGRVLATGRVLAAGVVAAAVGTLLTGQPATAAASQSRPVAVAHQLFSMSGGACTAGDPTTVTVVVDFQQLGGGVQVRCARGLGPGATGLDAIQAAGFTPSPVARWGLAFICRLQGRPAADEILQVGGKPYAEKCVNTPPPNAYWSYWQSTNGGSWRYSQLGASSQQAKLGGLEGWSFSLNATAANAPAPRVSTTLPEPPAPPTTPSPRTTSSRSAVVPPTTTTPTTATTPTRSAVTSPSRSTTPARSTVVPPGSSTTPPREAAVPPTRTAASGLSTSQAPTSRAVAATSDPADPPSSSGHRPTAAVSTPRTVSSTTTAGGTSTAATDSGSITATATGPATTTSAARTPRGAVVPPASGSGSTLHATGSSAAAGQSAAVGSTVLALSAAGSADALGQVQDPVVTAAGTGGPGTITVIALIIVLLAGLAAWLLARRRRTES